MFHRKIIATTPTRRTGVKKTGGNDA